MSRCWGTFFDRWSLLVYKEYDTFFDTYWWLIIAIFLRGGSTPTSVPWCVNTLVYQVSTVLFCTSTKIPWLNTVSCEPVVPGFLQFNLILNSNYVIWMNNPLMHLQTYENIWQLALAEGNIIFSAIKLSTGLLFCVACVLWTAETFILFTIIERLYRLERDIFISVLSRNSSSCWGFWLYPI